MKKADLYKKLIELEEKNDDLINEIIETDQIMRRIGFSDGLSTVKAVAYDMSKSQKSNLKKE